MIQSGDIRWAAGFIEGEGCVPRTGQLSVSAAQVQLWPLERLRSIFGGVIRPKNAKRYNPRASDSYEWQLHGPAAAGVLMTLYSELSPRRREAVRHALARWMPKAHSSENRLLCPKGHQFDHLRKAWPDRTKHYRICLTCERAKDRARYHKRRMAKLTAGAA